MTNRFLISVAAAALIAGTGFANAQGTGMSREGGATTQQSAPSSERGSPSAAPMNRDAGESKHMKGAQSNEKMAPNQRAQDDTMPGQKSKGMVSEQDRAKDGIKGGKDIKAEGREGRSGSMNAEQKGADSKGAADSKSPTTTQSQTGQSGQSATTTGQAGAGAKLSTEQRTQITSVIREQRVAPVAKVNFSIVVGTKVPRSGVIFHPLPARVVVIYPEWRGYEFILVNGQIVIINPRTLEIVAILEA